MPQVKLSDMKCEQQLKAWIEAYSDEILRVCFLYLSDRAQAEDALQETWIKVWKALRKGIPPIEHEKAWLMRIAINTCKDATRTGWFRHVDRRTPIEELPEVFLSSKQPDGYLSMTVMRLPEPFRQVILLYYYEGMTLQETGQALGLSVASVRRRLKKAEACLKKEWIGGDEP